MLETLGGVLVGEPREGPVTGADEHPGRTLTIRGRSRLEQMHRDLLKVALLAEFGQRLGGSSVEAGAAQDIALIEYRLAHERVTELEPPRDRRRP